MSSVMHKYVVTVERIYEPVQEISVLIPYERAVNAQTGLCICTDSPEPSIAARIHEVWMKMKSQTNI